MTDPYILGNALHDPSAATVDVIFLHGLGGHRTKTWTWEGSDRQHCWPKDSLPQACPTARILSFGYNAAFADFFPLPGPNYIPEQWRIDDHSAALLNSLAELREKTNSSDRPIIFVCHSVGGLVCANALSRHHAADVASAEVVDNTVGTIFLGTPFEGSSRGKWEDIALQILETVGMVHEDDRKDLEERSAKLLSVSVAFQKFLKARDRSADRKYVEVACFFEQYSMYKAGKKVGIIVPKESACLPGIESQSIAANHVDMCRFEDEERDGYKSISQQLAQWIANLEKQQDGAAGKDHSVYMGDVKYQGKIENNQGVIMGHAYGTTRDAVSVIGSSTTVRDMVPFQLAKIMTDISQNTYYGSTPSESATRKPVPKPATIDMRTPRLR